MTCILLGAPGSGKGTQGQLLAKRMGVPVISSGDMLRSAIREDGGLGRKIKSFVESGKLVPDEVMVEVMGERIGRPDCTGGYILDGFPRTIPQAKALDQAGMSPDYALSLEVPDSDIEARMTGRRVCPSCGASFHLIHQKPREEGRCDACNEGLIRRDDDDPDIVRRRLLTYHEQSEPLKGYYEKQGKLRLVVGSGNVSAIAARLCEALGLS